MRNVNLCVLIPLLCLTIYPPLEVAAGFRCRRQATYCLPPKVYCPLPMCNALQQGSNANNTNSQGKRGSILSVRPNSATFWNEYLNYDSYTTQGAVWDKIGGSIGESYGPSDENSCAARVSWGLNYGGSPVEQFSAASVNLVDHVYKGVRGDGKRYIVSAAQMASYLRAKWGTPDYQVTSPEQLANILTGLGSKAAIFATPNPPHGHGHSGVLKAGYTDPYVAGELPIDVWLLD